MNGFEQPFLERADLRNKVHRRLGIDASQTTPIQQGSAPCDSGLSPTVTWCERSGGFESGPNADETISLIAFRSHSVQALRVQALRVDLAAKFQKVSYSRMSLDYPNIMRLRVLDFARLCG